MRVLRAFRQAVKWREEGKPPEYNGDREDGESSGGRVLSRGFLPLGKPWAATMFMPMSTITAILEPSLDGMLHLAMPRELLGKKVRVTAQVEVADDEPLSSTSAGWDALARIAARDGLAGIEDPVAWQRELREDRPLPGREP
jgi:hypothetical protein